MRNQKFIIGSDSFSDHPLIYWPYLDNTSLCIDYVIYCNSLWLHVAKSKGSLKRLE